MAQKSESPRNNRSALCNKCVSIDICRPYCGPELVKEGDYTAIRLVYEHHKTLDELEVSAGSEKCHLCHLILGVINELNAQDALTVVDDWEHFDLLLDETEEDDSDDENARLLRQRYQTLFDPPSATIGDVSDADSPILLDLKFRPPMRDEIASRCTDVTVHWTNADGCTRRSTEALSLVSGLSDDLIRLCENRDIDNDTNTGSPYCTELARHWMRTCDAEHTMCQERRRRQIPTLPSRVIDVGDNQHHPFLYEPANERSVDYVCLSHCWGTGQPLTTKRSTLTARQQGIELSTMPKTFKDAIIVTRNLGIQYLWIDSLCIIQDSEEDWARESAKMGQIYRDAALTIFAEFADGDDGGCFMPREGKDTALCRTPIFDELLALIKDDNGPVYPTFIQQKLHHGASTSMPEQHHIFETVRYLDPRSTKPLNSRGWVLQETILSFRSLVYDQWEVRWSCPTMRACECVPEAFSRQTWLSRDKTGAGDTDTIDRRELFNSWSSIVSEFTKRKLTFGKDKLPALAGIASEMLHYNKSVYFAGLWKESLRQNLAWFIPPKSTNAPYRETTRPNPYRAPSWSWASIDGKVTPVFEFSNMQESAESNSDRFKRAARLECDILDCWTQPKSNLNPLGEIQDAALILRGRLGHAKYRSPVSSTSHVDRIPIENAQTGQEVGWFDPDVTPAANRGLIDEIWCMPLYNSWGELRCLALVSSSSKLSNSGSGNTYSRVGIVSPRLVVSGTWVDSEIDKSSYVKEDSKVAAANSGILEWLETSKMETVTVV